jgi:hypothetical protein
MNFITIPIIIITIYLILRPIEIISVVNKKLQLNIIYEY